MLVAVRAGPLRLRHAVTDFNFKTDFILRGAKQSNVKMIDVDQALELGQNGFKKRFGIESGAQRAANFVEHMKLFGAARRLLNEVTVFHRHPNLMAQCEQQAKLGCCKRAAVGRTEEQHTERL